MPQHIIGFCAWWLPITCNVGVPLLGKDSFQEVDIAGVVMPITKHSFIVKDVKKLAKTIRRAFVIAKSGRPGPVLVDITKDVTAAKTEFETTVPKPVKPYVAEIEEADLAKAADMIREAKRPFIFVGGGAICVQRLGGAAHTCTQDPGSCDRSLMGKGAFPARMSCIPVCWGCTDQSLQSGCDKM